MRYETRDEEKYADMAGCLCFILISLVSGLIGGVISWLLF